MKNQMYLKKLSIIIMIIFTILSIYTVMAEEKTSQKIYDFAELLTVQQIEEMESISNEYSEKRQVDIIILTTNSTQGKGAQKYMEDFYDENGLGYDKPHGNTAILTIDMENREVYVAGFYKGKEYLDNTRCDLIRKKITPDLSEGNYYEAFNSFIELSYRYMGIRPGVNPENVLFKLWFQVLASMIIAGASVMVMAYRSGGKDTTVSGTYLNEKNSKITDKRDIYVRTEITKHKKPSDNDNDNNGGGVSSGGHSHSGSGGSF